MAEINASREAAKAAKKFKGLCPVSTSPSGWSIVLVNPLIFLRVFAPSRETALLG